MTRLVTEDLTTEQIDALIEKAGGRAQVLRILSGALELQRVPTEPDPNAARRVTIAFDLDYEERVARGAFGWRNPDLSERDFPFGPGQAGAREQRLFHFNRSLSSADAIREIHAAGYEPATIGDILAFAEFYPEVQRWHPVVGLGSLAEIDGKLSLPALWFDGTRRTLDLIWFDGDWHRNYRFLGARPA